MRILLIEDDATAIRYLQRGLAEHSFAVDTCSDGDTGLHTALMTDYDLIILDVMLPGRSGWDVIAELRKHKRIMPVLMLTARDDVRDRVRGLELGADDYLVKPFAFAELMARIRTLLRRGPPRRSEVINVADVTIDIRRHRVTRAGVPIELTQTEFMLLAFLAEHPGDVVSRALIAEHVWNMKSDNETNVVDVHIRRLRAKIDDPFERKLIHTVRRVGYVLRI